MNRFSWDPAQYRTFDGPRMEPAADLLAKLADPAPARIVDLGCGPGNSTALLAARWPDARLTGVDTSPAMLAEAGRDPIAAAWVLADIAEIDRWLPVSGRPDLIYSNAALQWLAGHEHLIPALLDQLAPGGTLAVQMPNNYRMPALGLIADLAADHPRRHALLPALRTRPVMDADAYYDLLAGKATTLKIWETTYLHVLTGDNPVLEWTKGTALRPVLNALPEAERPAFEEAYGAAVKAAYPPRPDGRTLYPFRRLFIIVGKPG